MPDSPPASLAARGRSAGRQPSRAAAGVPFAAVTGGRDNIAQGDHASVSGGASATISGQYGAVSGGANNVAGSYACAVSGGNTDKANGLNAWAGAAT